jgi:hypothetical protein
MRVGCIREKSGWGRRRSDDSSYRRWDSEPRIPREAPQLLRWLSDADLRISAALQRRRVQPLVQPASGYLGQAPIRNARLRFGVFQFRLLLWTIHQKAMILEIFALAEHVSSPPGGSLTIVRTFRDWTAVQFPALIRGSVLSVIRFADSEEGPHSVEIVLRTADGLELCRAQSDFNVSLSNLQSFAAQHVHQLAVMIEKPGQNEITLYLDGVELSSLLLFVSPLKNDDSPSLR